MKLSKRLQVIADLIDSSDLVCDVGCDHAYLSLYLASKYDNKVIATEIADGPYNIAMKNIQNSDLKDKIKLYKTDGLNNVKDNINSIIIAGMGSNTIIHILSNYDLNNIDKIILQSNKDVDIVRKFINERGYIIQKEYYTNEFGKNYLTLYCIKGREVLTEEEILCGKFDSSLYHYYELQVKHINSIIKSIPKDSKLALQYNIYLKRIS